MRAVRHPITVITAASAALLLAVVAGLPARAAPDEAATSPNTDLAVVDCVSATFCLAIGNVGAAAVAERWNGHAWTMLPTPGKHLDLQGLSCVGATACIVTGLFKQASIVEEWNGSQWRKLPSADVGPISCVSMTDCVGLGGTQEELTASVWDGSTWTEYAPWAPDGPYSSWGGVSCTTATFCMAAGSGWINNDDEVAFADDWSDGAWNGPLRVVQKGYMPALGGVSCSSASDCVAIGDTGSVPMTERWDGTAWHLLRTPDPDPAVNSPYLSGVSCPEPARCVAVGSSLDAPHGFAEQLDGSTWTAQKVAMPTNGVFAAISCASVRDCLAVGWHDVGVEGRRQAAMSELWNGSSWQSEPVTIPA
ncbi:MAG: hypothetical protein ACRDNF_06020 [Streptosporangiaceae bacterium]